MAEFVCRVANAAGQVFEQVETARSEAELRERFGERGLFVYSIKPKAVLPELVWRRPVGEKRIKQEDFLVFNQQFVTLIRAGLPILKALDLLAERSARGHLREVLGDVRERVRAGALLSEAFEGQGIFPKIYTTSLLAGEKAGNLEGVLDHYVSYQRTTTAVRRKLLTALIYPCVLVLLAIGILSYVTVNVIPQFAKLYEDVGGELPPLTAVVIGAALNIKAYLLLAVVLIGSGLAALYAWSRTETGAILLDRLKKNLPVFGEVWTKFQAAQCTRTLATLLVGGIPVVSALDTAAESLDSRLLSNAVARAARGVREGQPLSKSLEASGVFPELAIEMIEVGEATGALPQMLTSVAEFFEEDVNLRLGALMSLIEPAILIFMGGVVAFILISLYLPIFSLAGQVH